MDEPKIRSARRPDLDKLLDNYRLHENQNGVKATSVLDNYNSDIKIQHWEQQLLNFSLHNPLLHIPLDSTLQLISVDVADLAAQLFRKCRSFHLEGCLDGFKTPAAAVTDAVFYLKQLGVGAGKQVRKDLRLFCLHTYDLKESMLPLLDELRTEANAKLKEKGEHSLYLSVGLLRWQEQYTKGVHVAPILLLPIDVVEDESGLNIKSNGDDVVLNVVLLEYLKQTFRMEFPGLEQAKFGNGDWDVQKVFDLISEELTDVDDWSVLEECLIANFSLRKLTIWRDIRSNQMTICKNQLVRRLMNKGEAESAEGVSEQESQVDPNSITNDLCLPLPCNPTQQNAVVEAMNEKSFILTGTTSSKISQTITNMISSALYKGRRVLVVAENDTAMDTTWKHLIDLGIDSFCMGFYSGPVDKQQVLDRLEQVLPSCKEKLSTISDEQADAFSKERKELANYRETLYRRDSKDDFTLYEAFKLYNQYKKEITQEVEVRTDEWPEITPANLKQYERSIKKIDAMIHLIGTPSEHPLKEGFANPESLMPDDELRQGVEFAEAVIMQLDSVCKDLRILMPNAPQRTVADVAQCFRTVISYCSLRSSLLAQASHHIFELDGEKLLKEWMDIQRSNSVHSYFSRTLFLMRLNEYRSSHNPKVVEDFLNRLVKLQTDPNFASISRVVRTDINLLRQVHRDSLTWLKSRKAIIPSMYLDRPTEVPIKELHGILHLWSQNIDCMKDWRQWCMLKTEFRKKKMGELFRILESTKIDLSVLKQNYFTAYFKALIQQKIESSPVLTPLHGLSFDAQLESYQKLSERFRELERQELSLQLSRQALSATQAQAFADEMNILRRNFTNRGKDISLSQLLSQIPDIIGLCCPCVLMSPQSVARYVNPASVPFDLVIVEEASQLPTSEAVCVLARGKNMVVVDGSKCVDEASELSRPVMFKKDLSADAQQSLMDDCKLLQFPSVCVE